MAKPLSPRQRKEIERLHANVKLGRLDRYLSRLSEKGFDVAGVPFRLLDNTLSGMSTIDCSGLDILARHTLGGQPRLFQAIIEAQRKQNCSSLDTIVAERRAHSMSRFEAMGWAVFLNNKASMPQTGGSGGSVFQYWDQPNPPEEIREGVTLWKMMSQDHVLYDDKAAHDFIVQYFGINAGKDYLKLWHPALKSDVFRLFRLAGLGGVYCDADSFPELGMQEFLERCGDRVWASCMTNFPNCVTTNWFIAAPPKHPLIEGLLDHVLGNIRDIRSRGIYWLSGPGAYTSYIYKHATTKDLALLPFGLLKAELFRQFDAPYKNTEMNWRVFEHKRGQDDHAGLECILEGL